MEILIGLVVVAVALIGWGYGVWPVALFLTLGDVFYLAMIGLFRNHDQTLQVFAIVSILVIWAPVILKRVSRQRLSPTLQSETNALELNLPPDRGHQIGTGIAFALTIIGVGWMYLHDVNATWDLITSRPFLTAMGFAALLGIGLGWANQRPKAM